VLRPICKAGFSGWLVVEAEQDPAKAHPLTYARLGFRNLKRSAEAAGFDVAAGTPKVSVDSPRSAA
jgi:inosose dehydratase